MRAAVDWNWNCANYPRLVVQLPRLPEPDEFVYRDYRVGDNTFYVSLPWHGLVRYYLHDPSDQTGSNGQTFRLRLCDGSERSITGPWSSRAGVINKHCLGYDVLGLMHIVDAAVMDIGMVLGVLVRDLTLPEEAILIAFDEPREYVYRVFPAPHRAGLRNTMIEKKPEYHRKCTMMEERYAAALRTR